MIVNRVMQIGRASGHCAIRHRASRRRNGDTRAGIGASSHLVPHDDFSIEVVRDFAGDASRR
jgi:hypothetical protein